MDSFLSIADQMAKIAKAAEHGNRTAFGNPFASTLQVIAQHSQRMQEVNNSFGSLASMRSIGSQMADIVSKQQKQLSGFEALAGLSQANLNQLAEAFSKLEVHSKLVEAIQPKSLESLFSFQSSLGQIISQGNQRVEPNAFSSGSAYAMALAVSETLPEAIALDHATREDVDNAFNELKKVLTESFDQLSAEGKESYEAGALEQLIYTILSGKISKRSFTIIMAFLTLLFSSLAFYKDFRDSEQMDRVEKNTTEIIQDQHQNNEEVQANFQSLSGQLESANAKIDSLTEENIEGGKAVDELAIKLDSCTAALEAILRITKELKSDQSAEEEE
ncbi:MAG: hypothetical protein ACK57W_01440 [Flavobacteriales bacterium]|jgi:hypothetical protein